MFVAITDTNRKAGVVKTSIFIQINKVKNAKLQKWYIFTRKKPNQIVKYIPNIVMPESH